ncbi:MAG: AI-2E family transporter [Bacteroidetes bacterium]|nr:AI-2E family transporter [Bacteroidota bacterium]
MNKTIKYILIFLGVVLLVYALWYFKSIVAYILISAVLSLVGHPIVQFLTKLRIKNFRLSQTLSATITLIFLWVVFLSFFRFFIPLIINEANELSSININGLIQNLQNPIEKVQEIFNKFQIGADDQSIQEYLTTKFIEIFSISKLSSFFGSLAGLVGNLLIAFFSISFISFFFLKEQGLFTEGILAFMPAKKEEGVRHVLHSIKHLLSRYFIGILIEILLIIILVTTGLTIVGINFNHAIVIGLLAGLLNVIPYIGPYIGAFFGIIIGIATNFNLDFYSQLLPLIGYMALVFVIVQLIDNILFQPLIYSSSVKAHPLEIFLVILMAGSLAGIPGMILAIPTYTVIRVVAKEFFSNFKIVDKLTKNI